MYHNRITMYHNESHPNHNVSREAYNIMYNILSLSQRDKILVAVGFNPRATNDDNAIPRSGIITMYHNRITMYHNEKSSKYEES
jgi:hypothetical protein